MPRRDPFTAACQQFAALRSRRLADLHAHTTASDGDSTPSQLVALARNANLSAIAVTDHDTLAGVAEAVAMGQSLSSPGIEVVPGVELSVSYREREIHVLGLFVDPSHVDLNKACQEMGEARTQRFRGYLAAIQRMGKSIPLHLIDRVEKTAASLGRRHVATLLVESGIVSSRHAAFTRVMPELAEQAPLKKLLGLNEAVALVRQAGGFSILAHPPGEFDEAVYDDLAAHGLDGIEVRHPSASNTQTDFLIINAKRHHMLVSAGSDYHGPTAAGISLGKHGAYPDEYAAFTNRASQRIP